MTAGTPLFISELSLAISLLAAVGWIATALTARLNLQRQIEVAAREAWMREFREQVAQFFTSVMRRAGTEGGTAAEAAEIRFATLSFHVTKLLTEPLSSRTRRLHSGCCPLADAAIGTRYAPARAGIGGL